MNCKEILENLKVPCFIIKEHAPITSYEVAKQVDIEFNLTGKESKCLFLKTKSNQYYVFVTTEEVLFDKKYMKELVNEKISIASSEELTLKSGYVPGCACPFGYPSDVKYIVDTRIFNYPKYICSLGTLTSSFEIETHLLKEIYQKIDADVTYIDDYPETAIK